MADRLRWRDGWPVRVVAAATVAYSVAMTVRPRILAAPCGLLDDDGEVPEAVTALTRSLGVRDASLAAALALMPAGAPMAVATAARVVSDGTDAVWLTRSAPESQRGKIAAVAGGWATLELLAYLISRRR